MKNDVKFVPSETRLAIAVASDVAAALGTKGGLCPTEAASKTILQQWHHSDPWCSPIVFAGGTEVFDFTSSYEPDRLLTQPYGIGRYDEDRRGMYETEIFKTGETVRTIHMGIDIGASVGTPVFAPCDAEVWGCDYLAQAGDYGGTVLLKTVNRDSLNLFMLFGHLSKTSLRNVKLGEKLSKGGLIGWLGEKSENGGWNPHLHWQLSWLEPLKADLPGAVSRGHRAQAKILFPDPTALLRVALGGWR